MSLGCMSEGNGTEPGQQEEKPMAAAYVLIEAAPKKALRACAKIAKISGVKSAHLVTGPYDIIAFVEAKDPGAIGKLVMARIQAAPGVGKTITCVVI
jgi:DNA-binding Lrp family transcriptional regulator